MSKEKKEFENAKYDLDSIKDIFFTIVSFFTIILSMIVVFSYAHDWFLFNSLNIKKNSLPYFSLYDYTTNFSSIFLFLFIFTIWAFLIERKDENGKYKSILFHKTPLKSSTLSTKDLFIMLIYIAAIIVSSFFSYFYTIYISLLALFLLFVRDKKVHIFWIFIAILFIFNISIARSSKKTYTKAKNYDVIYLLNKETPIEGHIIKYFSTGVLVYKENTSNFIPFNRIQNIQSNAIKEETFTIVELITKKIKPNLKNKEVKNTNHDQRNEFQKENDLNISPLAGERAR